MHTTWTSDQRTPRRRNAPTVFPQRVHIVIWWWPADEMPGLIPPLTTEDRYYLAVQLALLSQENVGAFAPLSASNDPGFNLRLVAALIKLRARAADAFSVAVTSCTASTLEDPFEAPLNLTTIQVCIQEQVSRDSSAPRGILVVCFLFSIFRKFGPESSGTQSECFASASLAACNDSAPAAGPLIGKRGVHPVRSRGSL